MSKRKGTHPLPTMQELINAKLLTRKHGVDVVRCAPAHYQIRTADGISPRWIIDLWPSTQTIITHSHYPPPGEIESAAFQLTSPWALMDIVEAVIAAMSTPKPDASGDKMERLTNVVDRLMTQVERLAARLAVIEADASDDDPVKELDALLAEVEAVTADSCDAKPVAEPVPEVTLADAEALLKAAGFTATSVGCTAVGHTVKRAAQILSGEMVASERRLQKQRAAASDETYRRVYLEDIVYAVRTVVQHWSGKPVVTIGTMDHPSRALVDAVRDMAQAAPRVTIEPLTGECDCLKYGPDEFTVSIGGQQDVQYVRTSKPPPIMLGLPPGLEARVKAKWPLAVLSYQINGGDTTFAAQPQWQAGAMVARTTMGEVIEWLEANTDDLPVEAEEKPCRFLRPTDVCRQCGAYNTETDEEPCASCTTTDKPTNFEPKT